MSLPAIVLACFLALSACHSGAGSSEADRAKMPVIRNDAPGAIVHGTLLSKSGDTLEYRYDNQEHTMDIRFKNVHSILKQDTAASGIRYSNEDFLYTEGHGISMLKQKGITVFETDAPVQ